jgi:hypothetical protein
MRPMSWLQTFLISGLTAAFAMLVGGVVASLGVDWYRISSFEGGSGYFVVFAALDSMFGGLVLGVVAARIVAAGANPGFLKGLGASWALVLAIGGVVAGTARALADVPPTLGGEQLMLLVELRWPASQQASPAIGATPHAVELGALSGNTLRASKAGPLWMEDARLEDGRWIVPGAVEIFTNRGARVLRIQPEIAGAMGLALSMHGSPGTTDLAWTEWMPRARPGAPPLPDGFSYRTKVIPRSQPSRTETLGAFQVDTIADAFHVGAMQGGQPVMAATARFAIRHRGQPVAIRADNAPAEAGGSAAPAASGPPAVTTDRVRAVATLPGPSDALLVLVDTPEQLGTCRVLEDVGGKLRQTRISRCDGQFEGELLVASPGAGPLDRSVRTGTLAGRIDRDTFAKPGSFLFANAIFDTASRAIRPVRIADFPGGFNRSVIPLGLSPDGLSIVRVGFSELTQGAPALLVQRTDGETAYLVEIDRAATRYAGDDALDGRWLHHYFEWRKDPQGHDRLAARTGVAPLPYRGVLHTESAGNVVYRLQPAGQALNDALATFLRTEFQAEALPPNPVTQGQDLAIGGVRIHFYRSEPDRYVSIFLDQGGDGALVRRIAERFDALLATGVHDKLFLP